MSATTHLAEERPPVTQTSRLLDQDDWAENGGIVVRPEIQSVHCSGVIPSNYSLARRVGKHSRSEFDLAS
jgi:hypothetical protein